MKRFKTEQEFISQYGLNWKQVIKYGWCAAMNDFFGKPYGVGNKSTWNISDDMLILASPEEAAKYLATLKDKTILENRIKIVSAFEDTQLNVSYTGVSGQRCYFYLIVSPTGNCQLSSICYFDNLLKTCSTTEELIRVLQHVKKYKFNKPLFFFDIKESLFDSKIKCLTYMAPPTKYISTNGSHMIYGIFKL